MCGSVSAREFFPFFFSLYNAVVAPIVAPYPALMNLALKRRSRDGVACPDLRVPILVIVVTSCQPLAVAVGSAWAAPIQLTPAWAHLRSRPQGGGLFVGVDLILPEFFGGTRSLLGGSSGNDDQVASLFC